ncbi:MAG: AtpZ/AtpI family protein [Ilumatobacter sp.]|nr:AtpZ/AtpI family protein [Ilumatobacter sp.]
MKLLPTQTRIDTQDSLGHGMDAAILLVVFLAAGYGLDRLFGTIPVFMVLMTVLGSIGLFLKFKYRYDERMDELEGRRTAGRAVPDGARPGEPT